MYRNNNDACVLILSPATLRCLLSLILFVGVLRVSCIMVSSNLYVYFGLPTGLSPECQDSRLRHQGDLHLPAESAWGKDFPWPHLEPQSIHIYFPLAQVLQVPGTQTAAWFPALTHITVLCRLHTTMCGTLCHCTSNCTVTDCDERYVEKVQDAGKPSKWEAQSVIWMEGTEEFVSIFKWK